MIQFLRVAVWCYIVGVLAAILLAMTGCAGASYSLEYSDGRQSIKLGTTLPTNYGK